MGAKRASLRERLQRGEAIDFRGDGKAGGGLVLVVQTFASAVAAAGELDVVDWPFFSSARKGANVRAYLRIARPRVETTCQVTQPDIALLMNEAAAEEVDFAEGTDSAMYVINTTASPAEAAVRYRLGGTIATVAGDELGQKYLGRPLGNIAVFAALVRVAALVEPAQARTSLEKNLEKRRIPQRLVTANLALFDDAFERVHLAELPAGDGKDHRTKAFEGYGALPVGAQAALRSSRKNRTSGYGRPGVRIEFADLEHRCNGCSLCVVECPEGIIQFTPDLAKGTLVYGAKFDDFCKVCRECVSACPLDLFHEVEVVTRAQPTLEGA